MTWKVREKLKNRTPLKYICCILRYTVKNMKNKKVFPKHITDKRLASRRQKLLLLESRTTEQINWQKIWTDTWPKKQSVPRATSVAIREIQSKPTVKSHYLFTKMDKTEINWNHRVLTRMWRNGNLHTLLVGMEKWTAILEEFAILFVCFLIKTHLSMWTKNPTPWHLLTQERKTRVCMQKFRANVSIIVKNWKQRVSPWTSVWVDKLWLHPSEY